MVAFRTDHLERSKLDLRAIIEEIVERQAPIADLKDIEFVQTTSPDCIVLGDAILIQNAITNIIDNAVKYSPHETVITVTLESGIKNVTLTITDQGPGFAADDIDALTNRFARGTNVGQTVGSGLGLTIANEVVKAHSGNLTLTQNTRGSGACVTLSLPA
jgi:two-component system sensor histidine kinase TctE